jgi:hypothetical protein
VDEIDESQIQFAYIRQIMDGRPKFIQVNFVGGGAPTAAKARVSSFGPQIDNFFKPAHLKVNARDVDELDEDEILEKCARGPIVTTAFHSLQIQLRCLALFCVVDSLHPSWKNPFVCMFCAGSRLTLAILTNLSGRAGAPLVFARSRPMFFYPSSNAPLRI